MNQQRMVGLASLGGLARAKACSKERLKEISALAHKARWKNRDLWSHVLKAEPDECWLFTGSKDGCGYGMFSVNGRKKKTHRLAWELTNGAIPVGMYICHRCDNPPCCNPSHLFMGTPSDNTRDMFDKGRSPSSKLSAEAVIEIRRSTNSQREDAARFGVSQSAISLAKRGETWVRL